MLGAGWAAWLADSGWRAWLGWLAWLAWLAGWQAWLGWFAWLAWFGLACFSLHHSVVDSFAKTHASWILHFMFGALAWWGGLGWQAGCLVCWLVCLTGWLAGLAGLA